ncbi:BatD family protein [Chitinophaga ginsengisoli]|uniref:Oxygen tolerance protein BatD n=1 Tax=Chitinophaga ginsengisoli TaxID=363837 RepID=A0A2P8GNE8_9BACT|nr:BatD family protein [Chitinophaga ginsengisoli]PSL35455.1 oxygen tolerance protein BatD [Chitinophaga ginsengisoli]
MNVTTVSIKKFVLSLLLCLGVISCLQAQEFRFTTSVSNNRVALDEPFQIQFMLENAPNVTSFTPPAFNDFEILQGPSQMQGQSIMNGRRSEYIALIYVIQAKKVGNFTLPGATARSNGNVVRSNPVTIEVVKGSRGAYQQGPQQSAPQSGFPPSRSQRQQQQQDEMEGVLRNGEDVNAKLRKNIFVKVDVDKTSLYEGEQLTATYKLYTRLPTNSSVTKVPAFKGFSAKDIELPNPPQASEEIVNGMRFKVFTIRKTLLFPLQSGTLELDPVEVDNHVKLVKLVKNGNKKSRDPFADLFNDPNAKDPFDDPFFDDFFNRPEVTYEDVPYKVQTAPLRVTVKPLPVDNRPASFTGAVGKFNMTAAIDKRNLTTDDALTLKVVVSGQGNVNLLNGPKVEIPAAFEKYDPKVSDNIEKNSNPLSGSRQFEYVLMPLEAGDQTIPAVEFSYFDVASNSYKSVRSEPFSVHVTPGKQTKRDKEDFSANRNTITSNYNGVLNWVKQGRFLLVNPLFYILLLIPVLLLVAAMVYRRRLNYQQNNAAFLKHRYANKVALKRLELAARYLKEGKDKAFYEETSRAIWGYLSNKLHVPFADLSKQLIQDKLTQQQVSVQYTAQLFDLLDDCEMALYTPMHNNDKMQGTYQQAVTVISRLEDELQRAKSVV